ncbi:dGTP triphosphohydrolase [Portibacter marinus]|uniref:dGTP triphosphohydrolase n=1 Tax=Portibacter marinus TaxID=2898660 RepID=UPI001F2BDCA9|nr:dNTP triphosphohydrolase [Portibacter marinus]
MNWNTCFTSKSLAESVPKKDGRSNFQKDYDRIIFSSSFRRLQNKTQVFPLPGTTFVHNRLTHSLEVASVGRSLGELVGHFLIENDDINLGPEAITFYSRDLSSVISSGCLAHDIGNPAFGHSGEEAISNFFKVNDKMEIDGKPLREFYQKEQWRDLTLFEGNANALRVLTQSFRGKSPSGLGLTLTTLASILKYPCSSSHQDKSFRHRKKYGYFQSEKEIFKSVAQGLGFKEDLDAYSYHRHPFVYLVEAADDICYNIIDMEDAHRIGLLSKAIVSDLFLDLIKKLDLQEVNVSSVLATFKGIGDDNESIAYLRAKCISALVIASVREFMDNQEDILKGEFSSGLIDEIERKTGALKEVEKVSYEQIYRHESVLEIEVAGFHVMSELLSIYLPAVLRETKSHLDKTIVALIPGQYHLHLNSDDYYLRTMNVLDHISGMTDAYATELYRKLKGIEI